MFTLSSHGSVNLPGVVGRTGLLMVKLQEGYHLYEELHEDNRCELYEDEKDVLLACLFWSFPVMF